MQPLAGRTGGSGSMLLKWNVMSCRRLHTAMFSLKLNMPPLRRPEQVLWLQTHSARMQFVMEAMVKKAEYNA